jgi:hypothetical protein
MPLRELEFDALVSNLLPDEDMRYEWLNSPNKMFYTMTPHEMFHNDPDEAIALLKLLSCTGEECDILEQSIKFKIQNEEE